MSSLVTAILAVCLMAHAAICQDLERPLAVRFQQLDGTARSGRATSWSEASLTGSFGTVSWYDMQPQDVYRIRKQLINRRDADAWLLLSRDLLAIPDGATLAEQSIRKAQSLSDDDLQERIAEIREAGRLLAAREQQRRRMLQEQQLRKTLPEGDQWEATPWPVLTDRQREEALETMKQDAQELLSKAGLSIKPIETEYFLLYSELPAKESQYWAGQLDAMYERLLKFFGVSKGLNLFWGKAVIVISENRDQFRVIEASSFNQIVPPGVIGLCHTVGPKVFVNTYLDGDELQFAAVLVHETVHGIMHRFLTPKRLPAWANEGFAEWVAANAFAPSPVDRQRRFQGLTYIRNGGNVSAVLDMDYTNATWPGQDAIGYALGYLLCDVMISDRAPKFGSWVRAIKDGKPWKDALKEDFGVSPDVLVQQAVRYYRVND